MTELAIPSPKAIDPMCIPKYRKRYILLILKEV